MESTNNIIVRLERVAKDGRQFEIKIRLNDECKNGHQDFSITGTIYEAGKRKTEKNSISSGAIGDYIAEEFEDLAIFNRLHLCDYLGNPMYATANGFYHLKNGFNRVSADSTEFKGKFCEYYRISPDQFEELKNAESREHYAILLLALNIPDQWKKEADQAIKQLEELSGKKFIVDSTKTNLGLPAPEVLEQETQRIKAGYYAPEKIKERADQAKKDAKSALIKKLKDQAKKDVQKIETELNIKLLMVEKGIDLDCLIYYSHSNKITFNWFESQFRNKLSEGRFNELIDGLTTKDKKQLPAGVTMELKGVREVKIKK